MKIINTAMVLESGAVTKEDKFDVTKPIRIGRFTITDFHPSHSWLNYEDVFITSSNIGSAKMAMTAGCEKQHAFFKKVGLLKSTKLEIPETGSPLYPSKWREISAITISYGYGISITPMHLVSVLGGVITGTQAMPTLIKDKKVEKHRLVSEKTAKIMTELLFRAAKESVVGKGKVEGVDIGGKTGTANLRSGKGYQKKEVFTSYFAVFPDKPRYAVFVMLENPKAVKGTYRFNNAGWNATPTAAKIISRIAPILCIQPALHVAKNSVLIKHISLTKKQH